MTNLGLQKTDMSVRLRILLAEDHKDMRDRIAGMLEKDFEVVGAVSDGRALLDAESNLKPDVAVLDISMPVMSGIEAAIELKRSGSQVRIIFLTMHEDPDFVGAALDAGASAYVVKSRMASDLCTAINEAMAGQLFVSPCVPYVRQTDRNREPASVYGGDVS